MGTQRVRVVDKDTRVGVPGATVEAFIDFTQVGECVTGSDGTCEISSPYFDEGAKVAFTVTQMPEGYVCKDYIPDCYKEVTLFVPEVVLELTSSELLCEQPVRVVDQFGEPVPDVLIGAWYDDALESHCKTGSEGECTLTIERGKTYIIRVDDFPEAYECEDACEEEITACTDEVLLGLKRKIESRFTLEAHEDAEAKVVVFSGIDTIDAPGKEIRIYWKKPGEVDDVIASTILAGNHTYEASVPTERVAYGWQTFYACRHWHTMGYCIDGSNDVEVFISTGPLYEKSETRIKCDVDCPGFRCNAGEDVKLEAWLYEVVENWLDKPLQGRRIDFYVDDDLVGTSITNEDGYASIITKPRAGMHTFTAKFDGDDKYLASSGAYEFEVGGIPIMCLFPRIQYWSITPRLTTGTLTPRLSCFLEGLYGMLW